MKIEKNTTDDGDIISFKFSLCFFIVIIHKQGLIIEYTLHSDKDYVLIVAEKSNNKID
jgi:hypothetical protein